MRSAALSGAREAMFSESVRDLKAGVAESLWPLLL